MPRRVRLTNQAVRDLHLIYRWQLQPGSGPAAKRRVQAIRDTIGRLGQIPYYYVGGDHPGTREATCFGHRIVYVVNPDTGRNDDEGLIIVLRVFGPGQSRQI